MLPGEAFARWERSAFHSRLVWLFPAAFALHILEEGPRFSHWVTSVLGGAMEPARFYLNNGAYMALTLGLTAWASVVRSRLAVGCLFFWVSGQMFWNAVFHVYTEHQFRTYSPGFFSAVFLYIPVYGYLNYVALRERYLSFELLAINLLGGAIGMLFTIWAGLYRFGEVPLGRWF